MKTISEKNFKAMSTEDKKAHVEGLRNEAADLRSKASKYAARANRFEQLLAREHADKLAEILEGVDPELLAAKLNDWTVGVDDGKVSAIDYLKAESASAEETSNEPNGKSSDEETSDESEDYQEGQDTSYEQYEQSADTDAYENQYQ